MLIITMKDMYTDRGTPETVSESRLMMTGMIPAMTEPIACMFISIVANDPLSFSSGYAVAMYPAVMNTIPAPMPMMGPEAYG